MSNEDEFSIDLDEESVRSGSSRSRGSEASGGEEGSVQSSVWSFDAKDLDAKGRISLLSKLRDRMQDNDLFDEQDVKAVTNEIERVEQRERNSFETKLKERLRILAKFDGYLSFKQHHPSLNAYFLKKQKKMQKLARRARENGAGW